MSKEISKFRAWVKDLKEYRVVASIHYVLMNKEWTAIPSYVTLYGNKWADKDISRAIQDVVLEQSTGLEDKNGKEIWVGDIVRVCHNCYGKPNKKGDRQLVEETFNCIVVWDTYKIGFKHQFAERASYIYDWNDFKTHRFHDVTKIEIVGNVHENKELLDGSN